MQKRIIDSTAPVEANGSKWINLEACAGVELTSEAADHPIEGALRAGSPRGWEAAQPGPQSIRIRFHEPRSVRRIRLCFEANEPRTQEFVLRWSNDGGLNFRDVVRQQFNFSANTRREDETYSPNLEAVTDLKLDLVPDISGGTARASLRQLLVAES